MALESVWSDVDRCRVLNQERVQLEDVVYAFNAIEGSVQDNETLLELAIEEKDQSTLDSVADDLPGIQTQLESLEFKRMFDHPEDPSPAYVDIQSGSGGTEAQDWAEMLFRMYSRWAEAHNMQASVIEYSSGEVAGIKSATIHLKAPYAFGWLRSETGVHRLVRKSPFDSGSRRHTSFASVFVSPELDDSIEVDINPADLRIDTYRSSGAGGQHVNTTDSAIRITHEPTGVVVQCQSERSQHQNKANAMKQLKAKLHQVQIEAQSATKQALEASKSDISWGHQIRSYVLDQSRIKDLRTGVETSNCQAVLDGDIDRFIEAYLKQQTHEDE